MEKHAAIADVPAEFDGHPHWQLAQRIVISPQFARSTRLKSFLLYVVRCALLDQAEQVTEQQIGVHVFGLLADYNAGEDNIVRSQARFLRAKLSEYFESAAGQEEPVVLTIPKGSYLPHFVSKEEAPTHVPEPAPAPSGIDTAAPLEPLPVRTTRKLKTWIGVLVAGLILAALTIVLVRQRPAARVPDSPLWSKIFDGRRTTTIVASDYIFSMVQEAAGRTLTLDEYLGADYFNRVAQLNAISGLERLFPNIAQRHYTGFENVTSVARLMAVKQAQSTATVVRFARDLTMRDIGAGNLILVGSKQSNPWVSLFEDKLNFRFEYEHAGHNVVISNRKPSPGEEAEYRPSALDALSRVIYGGIAFVPNLNRAGNVLLLQGTSMGGAEVALEILANPELFRDLRRHLTTGKDRDLPYFEAIIRTRTVNGIAGESEILVSRVLSE